MNEQTTTGTTTRPITVALTDHHSKHVTGIETIPAGTTVYARPNRHHSDRWNIRVPGTLLTQTVHHSAFAPLVLPTEDPTALASHHLRTYSTGL